MEKYLDVFSAGYQGYAQYLWQEITHPHAHNYFYWLLGVSLFFFVLEGARPWRRTQPRFRQDFWLDAFYMFFNFFLFSLLIYNAASYVVVTAFNDAVAWLTGGFDLQVRNPMRNWPTAAVLLVGFLVRDFVQWWVHRLLHTVPTLWEFHKLHHSIEQMGFSGHLRYHFMENVIYRSLEYLPLALLGIGLYDFFLIHLFTLAVGHYNHSNLSVPGSMVAGVVGAWVATLLSFGAYELGLATGLAITLGAAGLSALLLGRVVRYVLNSPEMHIWHHAYHLPAERPRGINFGITLSVWDYLFGTAYIPHTGRDIRLGFPGVEAYPKNFFVQNAHGFGLTPQERREKVAPVPHQTA